MRTFYAKNRKEWRKWLEKNHDSRKEIWLILYRKDSGFFIIGESFTVTAELSLGDLRPEEVEVELYYGQLKTIDKLSFSQTQGMEVEQALENGRYIYTCKLTCESAGRFGFTVRVTPKGDDYLRFTPGLSSWA